MATRARLCSERTHRSLHLRDPGRLALFDKRFGALTTLRTADCRRKALGRVVKQLRYRARTGGAQHQRFRGGDGARGAFKHLIAGIAYGRIEGDGVGNRDMRDADRGSLDAADAPAGNALTPRCGKPDALDHERRDCRCHHAD